MSVESIRTLQKAIRYIRGENNVYASCMASVTAFVRNKEVISEEPFQITITMSYDHADVGIFWENHGYANFKALGLYGLMNSNFQDFIDTPNNTFKIVTCDNSYEILVNYNNGTHIE